MNLYDVFYTDDAGNQTLAGTWNDVDLAMGFAEEHYGVSREDAEQGGDIVASWESPDGEGTITIVERNVDG